MVKYRFIKYELPNPRARRWAVICVGSGVCKLSLRSLPILPLLLFLRVFITLARNIFSKTAARGRSNGANVRNATRDVSRYRCPSSTLPTKHEGRMIISCPLRRRLRDN